MAEYKLTYLDVPGRGEPIRLLFAAAKIPFVDHRINRVKDWPSLKPSTPWGQVPILETDGKVLAQSLTICRYLARKFGFVGANEWEAAKCDEYVDVMSDILTDMKKIAHAASDQQKFILKTKFINDTMPDCLNKFEKILRTEAENPESFLVGEKMTWADIFVTTMLARLAEPSYFGNTLFIKYPRLKALKISVESYPGIKEYLDNRH